jgi:hypothetical protein
MVKEVLYDRHIEYRLDQMVELERTCKRVLGLDLFIHCDMETRMVHYEVESVGFAVSLPFGPFREGHGGWSSGKEENGKKE